MKPVLSLEVDSWWQDVEPPCDQFLFLRKVLTWAMCQRTSPDIKACNRHWPSKFELHRQFLNHCCPTRKIVPSDGLCMNACMNECMNAWMHECMNACMKLIIGQNEKNADAFTEYVEVSGVGEAQWHTLHHFFPPSSPCFEHSKISLGSTTFPTRTYTLSGHNQELHSKIAFGEVALVKAFFTRNRFIIHRGHVLHPLFQLGNCMSFHMNVTWKTTNFCLVCEWHFTSATASPWSPALSCVEPV
jgi:hypothetical protein